MAPPVSGPRGDGAAGHRATTPAYAPARPVAGRPPWGASGRRRTPRVGRLEAGPPGVQLLGVEVHRTGPHGHTHDHTLATVWSMRALAVPAGPSAGGRGRRGRPCRGAAGDGRPAVSPTASMSSCLPDRSESELPSLEAVGAGPVRLLHVAGERRGHPADAGRRATRTPLAGLFWAATRGRRGPERRPLRRPQRLLPVRSVGARRWEGRQLRHARDRLHVSHQAWRARLASSNPAGRSPADGVNDDAGGDPPRRDPVNNATVSAPCRHPGQDAEAHGAVTGAPGLPSPCWRVARPLPPPVPPTPTRRWPQSAPRSQGRAR